MGTGTGADQVLKVLLAAAPGEATSALRARLAPSGAAWPAAVPPHEEPAPPADVHRHRPARTLPRTAAGLAELAARHLADAAPDRWRALHDALPAHRGTLPELLELLDRPPASAAAGAPRRVPAGALELLGALLDAVPAERAVAALRALPDAAVRGVLARGAGPGPALTAAVAAAGATRERIALAEHPQVDPRVLKRLVAAADPEVNASVWLSRRSTFTLRRAIAAAHPEVPFAPRLRDHVVGRAAGHRDRAPLLATTDPELAEDGILAASRISAQAWSLAGLWERHGPAPVRALAERWQHMPESLRECLDGCLARGDRAALLDLVDDYADPAHFVDRLQRLHSSRALKVHFEEPFAYDGAVLAAGHRAGPFMGQVAAELSRHEELDDEQRAVFRSCLVNDHWDFRGGAYKTRALETPAERLAAEPLPGADYYLWDGVAAWARAAHRAGMLADGELLRVARPAGPAAALLAELADRRGRLPMEAAAPIAALVAEHLAGHPDAWAVLLSLAGTFTGTLAELIATAGAASGPRPAGAAAVEADPSDASGAVADPDAPERPRTAEEGAGVAAVQELRDLAPDGDGGPPEVALDRGTAAYLARTLRTDLPGAAVPDWLSAACRDAGLPDPAGDRPTPDGREMLTEAVGGGPLNDAAGALGYLAGLCPADELCLLLPLDRMLTPTHGHLPAHLVAARRRLGDRVAAMAADARRGREEELSAAAALRTVALTLHRLGRDGRLYGLPRTADELPSEAGAESRSGSGSGSEEGMRAEADGKAVRALVVDLLALCPAPIADAVVPELSPEERVALAERVAAYVPAPRAALAALLREPEPGVVEALARRAAGMDARSRAMLIGARRLPLAKALALAHDSAPERHVLDGLSGREPVRLQLGAALRFLLDAGPEALAARLDTGRLRPTAVAACRAALDADEPALALATRMARESVRPRRTSARRPEEVGRYCVRLDDELASGFLTPREVLEREPAGPLLQYLGTVARRGDAPQGAVELRELAREAVRRALAADPGTWQRAVRRLAHRDAGWRARARGASLGDLLKP
ncbi:hypothetical protein BIV57_17165 [Mangrovactinospora gilvigrisea]|uniref:Uncharacterized protein n=1 Tax=Mangrovactinospora gilvigrisea TaxID=1428644 RepID=A0A1J7BC63_9ACTN|nr:hypothetical protein [Mangrovactinospora gilvigrisea]OIV36259.1 hypothetical protein BIV57_17165 [Mangrovactinospora gilvigrisea]